jgi:hypothetical protein
MCDGTQEPDETMLLQVDHRVKPAHKRRIDVEQKADDQEKEHVREESKNHDLNIESGGDADLLERQKTFFAHSTKMQEILKRLEEEKRGSNDESKPKEKIWPLHHKIKKQHKKKNEMVSEKAQQVVAYVMPATQFAGTMQGAGAYPGAAQGGQGLMAARAAAMGPDYFTNSVTYSTQVSPGASMEDPKRAAARAAQTEERAERAMENAVWKSQQHERAATFAAKMGGDAAWAGVRAADMQKMAAKASVEAADAMQNNAVMQASAQRAHARLGAYKAAVQGATAAQASAAMLNSEQGAASARAATNAGIEGLHSMEMDLEASDPVFNNGGANRFAQNQYHNAMDSVAYDRGMAA